MVNERNFIKYLKKQNPKVLDYIADNYSNIIFKVAFNILNNRELAEECLNDVLYKIWENGKGFNRDIDKFYPWVVVMTKYTAIDIFRKEKKHSNTVEIEKNNIKDNYEIEDKVYSKDNLNRVTKEINKMDKVDREIFLRKFYFQESNSEISKRIGLEAKSINVRIFRGRKKLKNKLGDEVVK